jgi:dTDP-4-dehydrorhamnose reductase
MNETHHQKTVVVLGADGFVGTEVFRHFQNKSYSVFGTSRHGKQHLFFDANNLKESSVHLDDIPKGAYIVNCIGSLKRENADSKYLEQMNYTNALFPHLLYDLCKDHFWKFIHISSDAVFQPNNDVCIETTATDAIEPYGRSKALGEIHESSALTIRTSFLGRDSAHQKGLLEWALHNTASQIDGYSNQQWTGCTTPQFAQFCEYLIQGGFDSLTKMTNVVHFVPIQKTTKFDILLTWLKLHPHINTKVKETTAIPITRKLDTLYKDFFTEIHLYNTNLETALRELKEDL